MLARFARFGHAPLLVAFVALGCNESTDSTDSTDIATGVRVDPTEFLGALACAEGAARSYKAELVNAGTEQSFATSARVSCGASVLFTDLELGELYGARISVFRETVDEAAGSPAWATECGLAGSGAAKAVDGELVTVRSCEPIVLEGEDPTVVVDLTSLVGEIGCDAETGGIAELDVVPEEGNPLPSVTVACDTPVVNYGSGIEPGTVYRFTIAAKNSAGELSWGSRCEAAAQASSAAFASCSPLASSGTASFPIPALLEAEKLACADFDGALIGVQNLLNPKLVPCSAAPTVALPAGPHKASVSLLSGGLQTVKFACNGTVLPGSQGELTCVRQD
jgi:hypothetical protein